MRRMQFILLALLACLLPAGSAAAAETPVSGIIPRTTVVHPWYAQHMDVSRLLEERRDIAPQLFSSSEPAEYVSMEEAEHYLIEQMKKREETITLHYWKQQSFAESLPESARKSVAIYDFPNKLRYNYLDREDPAGGDYVFWSYLFFDYEGDYSLREGTADILDVTVTLTVTYYSTPEQEAAVDAELPRVLASLDLDGKSDYQRICTVYDYLCQNITYDYEHWEDDDYYPQFTAYAALIEHKAVCQGYATLFYRMMLSLGIDCRIVVSDGHAWNIVRLGGMYYNADATWDAENQAESGRYDLFLRSKAYFDQVDSHTRQTGIYSGTPQFYRDYPESDIDYITYSRGDVNGDSAVDAADLTVLARHVAKIEEITSPALMTNADTDKDKTVAASDLTRLARYVARIISEF